MTITKLLPETFTGAGEVKGFTFTRVYKDDNMYIYQVNKGEHYEVFQRKSSPVCVDFAKRIYSETKKIEIYPKAKDFGIWAWSFYKFESAMGKLTEIN